MHVPTEVYEGVVASQGLFFQKLSGIDPLACANDLLSEEKAHQQAAILERFARLRGAKLLEVGNGLGVNLLVWNQQYGADVTGIEPDGAGFNASFELGRALLAANGCDQERIVNAVGEELPFPDCTFDIVYSTNVLEHTVQPITVLHEALRVLRPSGVLQFVFPNYGSYYDGHYGVFHPPIPFKGFFPWYVRYIWRRDPAFARELRTELNVAWTYRTLKLLRQDYRFDLLGLGQDVFCQRMSSLQFNAWANLGRVKRLLTLFRNRKLRELTANAIVSCHGWSPIILTLRKSS